MSTPFAKLEEKSSRKAYSQEDIRSWMKTSKEKRRKSTVTALFIGPEKSGKSGALLDCRTDEEKEDGMELIIFQLGFDGGCEVTQKEHHNDDYTITVLDPKEFVYDTEKGKWIIDRVTTMEKLNQAIKLIKDDIENNGLKTVIGFDGLDSFQSKVCEGQMRMDHNLDVTGGVSPRYWKKRNEYYDEIVELLLSIDADIYFITHYVERSRDKDTALYNDKRTVSKLNSNFVYACDKSTANMMSQIVEFSDETKIVKGKTEPCLKATIISDRRDLNKHMEEKIIASQIEGKVIWAGKAILKQ